MLKKKVISMLMAGVMSFTIIPGVLLTATTVQAADTSSGLVARWTFDDNYTESVSGLTTNLGAKNLTYTKGVHGKAAVFNGKDNYLYVTDDSTLNLGNSHTDNNDNFTISAWINLGDSKIGEKYLLDKGTESGWDHDDNIFWSNPYRLLFDRAEPTIILSNVIEDDNLDPELKTIGDSFTGYKTVEGEEWFLLTVTYDGQRVKIYHDNQLLTQNNYTDGITFNNEELYIGVDHTLQSYFKGAVDDLRIYTRTFSYDDVEAIYQEGLSANKEFVEPTKQLVAYYSFDDNLKDSSQFKNDAEKVAVGGTTKYVIGKNGQAITMSKGNYIQVPSADQLNFDNEFSVTFWLKVDGEGDYPVLYRQNPSYGDENDNEWAYQLSVSSGDKGKNSWSSMYTQIYNPDIWVPDTGQSLNFNIDYSETKIKTTSWVHYSYTYKEGQMKSYLNGKLQKKTDKSDFVNICNASGSLLIGYNGDTFINGAIDELKIYNKCLSDTDVSTEAKRIDAISLGESDSKIIASIGKGKAVTVSMIILKDRDTNQTSTIKSSDGNVLFNSSNKKIFTVTNSGEIKAIKAGEAKLTITYGGNVNIYKIQVK